MTNRAINKAIAEFLRWKELDFHLDGKRILGDRPTFSNGKIISYTVDQYVPDYCKDLNEMHGVEEGLTEKQQRFYQVWLMKIQKADYIEGCWFAIHATASQRAEAFVRTIGKWKE